VIVRLQEYRVTLPQQPTQQQLRLLKAGTTIEGVHVVPKRVQLLQPPSVAAGSAHQGPARGSSSSSSSSSSSGNAGVRRSADGRCVLCIEVSEGKKHEVRSGRMFLVLHQEMYYMSNMAADSTATASWH
jgi:16S rRNA U516 pseudouridylate synthase RsuA-like enzyme